MNPVAAASDQLPAAASDCSMARRTASTDRWNFARILCQSQNRINILLT